MKHRQALISCLVIACAIVAFAALADEGHEQANVTVKGEILDMACYVSHGAKGADHAGCAKRCAKGGQPLGLLADDGTVYLLYASHKDGSAFEQAKEHAGEKVEISGAEATQGGLKGIEVQSVKTL